MTGLGKRLREIRFEKGLTLKEVAKSTDFSHAAISCWEIEERMPSAYAIYVLAKFYKVSADYILGLTD